MGVWIIIFPLLQPMLLRMKHRSSVLVKREVKTANALVKVTEKFLEATLNVHSSFAVFTFYFILLVIAIMSFFGLYSSGRPFFESCLWMIISPCLVIGFLFLKLYGMRIKLSYEGKEMVNELLNNYRIHHFNIVEAVEQTVYGLGDKYPLSKKVMTRLALDLKVYKNDEELREIVNNLDYQIDSNWSKLLANLIFIAASKGDDITEGLIDISRDLADLDHINEKNRQLNIEGGIMLKIIVPLTFFGGIYALMQLLGFTFKQYINYQFFNPIGFTMFYYMVIVTTFTILVYLFLRQEKNDY